MATAILKTNTQPKLSGLGLSDSPNDSGSVQAAKELKTGSGLLPSTGTNLGELGESLISKSLKDFKSTPSALSLVRNVSAGQFTPTQVKPSDLPSKEELDKIQTGLLAGNQQQLENEKAKINDFFARTGLTDSNVQISKLGRAERESLANEAGLRQVVFNMALNRAGLEQKVNIANAMLLQDAVKTKFIGDLTAGTFNSKLALDAVALDMANSLQAIGLGTSLLLQDYQLALNEEQAYQDSLSSFIETALSLSDTII